MKYIKMQTLVRRSMLAIILAWAAQAMPLRGAGVDSGIDIPDFGTNRPPVQTFYLPIPENDLLTALKIIENGKSGTPPTDPMQTYVSLAVFVDGTVIYYDQWENGYDRDIANPNNLYSASNLGGTQIWGDGDTSNGTAPGYSSDKLSAGDVIILANAVKSTTRQSVIDWDGSDKIGVTKPIAVTRAGWATGPNTLMADANEVFDTTFFGKAFESPVGTDSPDSNQMFEYSALMIMASTDATTVQVDADRDGTFESTYTINEGESAFVNGGVKKGGRIVSDKPVQVELITGDISSNYESRFFRLLPTSTWADALTTPVATAATVDGSTSGTRVWLYNPNAASITVRKIARNSSNSSSLTTNLITLAANANSSQTLTEGCAARFESTNGDHFYALSTTDSTSTESNGSGNQTWDWGFSLVPDDALTPQVLVGLGIGRDPTSSSRPSENGSPVWVTPIGNGNTKVRVYVDYDSDPTTGSANGVDPNGNKYDAYYDLRELVSQKIFNPSGDQTGVLIYTVQDGVKLAAAWGADPKNTSPGAPGLDFGTGIPPLPAFYMQKTSSLQVDSDGDGYITPNDVIHYDILIENIGRQPVTDIRLRDTLPSSVAYVNNSTFFKDEDGVTTQIADRTGASPFPLGVAGGYLFSDYLPVAGSWHVTYNTKVGAYNANSGVENIQNNAIVSSGATTYTNGVIDSLRGRVGDYVWLDVNLNGIQDAGETGVNGIGVRLLNQDGTQAYNDFDVAYEFTTRTDDSGRDGFYLFTGVRPGQYIVEFSTPSGYAFTECGVGESADVDSDVGSGDNANATESFRLDGGQFKLDVDAGLIKLSTISGSVLIDKDGDGVVDAEDTDPLFGVTVALLNSSGTVVATTTTQANGSYSFTGLLPGSYTIRETDSSGWTSTSDSQGINDNLIPVTIAFGQDSTGNMFYDTLPVSIGDKVWIDTDRDGIQDAGETGLAGVTVELLNTNGTVVATTNTTATGAYLFSGKQPGTYRVKFTPPAGYASTTRDAGSNDAVDSDAAADGVVPPVTLTYGTANLTIDAGFFRPTTGVEIVKTAGSAADGATLTINGSANVLYTYVMKNTGETYLSNLVVTDDKLGAIGTVAGPLAPNATTTLTKTATAVSASVVNTATVTANPTDATGTDMNGLSDVTDTDDARVIVIPYASIGNLAWVDQDGDGVQDAGEPGLGGVTVVLYLDGTQVSTTTTGSNGSYLFENLLEGNYSVGFTTPYGYAITSANVGDDAADSDIAAGTGRTASFALVGGAHRTDIDAGFTRVAASVQIVKTAGSAADGAALTFQGTNDVVYTYTVKNTGSTYLTSLVVTDDKLGSVGTVAGPLAPNATTTLTKTASAVFADVVNLGSVSATPSSAAGTALVGFDAVTDTDDATVDVIPYSSIGDRVWNDLNKNGVQEAGEPGLAGFTVVLSKNGTPIATTTTDATGAYGFANLYEGDYSLKFTPASTFWTTTANAAADSVDSDVDATGSISAFHLGAGVADTTRDAGYYRPVAGVSVTKTAGSAVDGASLTINGSADVLYTYVVRNTGETSLSNLVVTDDKLGDVGTIAGPLAPNATTTLTKTATAVTADVVNVATITANPTDETGADLAGLEDVTDTDDASVVVIPYSSLGNFVWVDLDKDGVQDAGEPGLAGVAVTLYKDGEQVATTTTDAQGAYIFEELLEGSYTVGFTTPYGYAVTLANVGDDAADSDVAVGTGLTGSISLVGGANLTNVDAGFTCLEAAVEVVKTAGSAPDGTALTFQGTNDVIYTYTVKNTGATYLTDLVVTDDKLGAIGTVNGPLAPNATTTLTKTATAVSADVVNVATVTANPSDSEGADLVGFDSATDTDDASVVVVPYSFIGDFVWNDLDKDGIQDAGESGLAGFTVVLYKDGAEVATTTTDANGAYGFNNLFEGDYSLKFTPPSSYWATERDATADSADSDVDETGATASFHLGAGAIDRTRDAGFVRPAASVSLVKTAGNAADGATYTFYGSSNVVYTYEVKNTGETYLANLVVTDDKLGDVGTIAGPLAPNATTTLTKTATAVSADVVNVGTVTANPTDETGADLAGLEDVTDTDDAAVVVIPYSSIGNFVWVDLDKDGVQDAGEAGLADVAVTLYKDGAVFATTTTDSHGAYVFENLLEGTYEVGFVAPSVYKATVRDVGGDAADSDLDSTTGRTGEFTLHTGVQDNTRDAGLILLSASLEVVKTAGNADDGTALTINGSADVLYTYVVRNTGETYLSNIAVSDDKLGNVGTVAGPLAPNATATLTKTATAVTADVVNVATATANPTDSNGVDFAALEDVSDTDDASVIVIPYSAIGDFVWIDLDKDGIQDAGEPGLAGVAVTLFKDSTEIATTTTDATGAYAFEKLLEGSYTIGFATPYGYAVTAAHVGDEAADSDIAADTGLTEAFVLAGGANRTDLDAGFTCVDASVEIVKTAGTAEDGAVLSFQGTNDVVYTYVVKNTGSTYLSNLVVTDDKLGDVGTVAGPLAPNATTTLTATATAVAVDVVNVATVTADPTDDAGQALAGFETVTDTDDARVEVIPYSSIGNFVWIDLDKDGVQDDGEAGLPGVTVTLFKAGVEVATTTTDAQGAYAFEKLLAGDYSLGFLAPTGYRVTIANVGGDDTDSDIDADTGRTAEFALDAGASDDTRDAGFYLMTTGVEIVKTAGDAPDGTDFSLVGFADVVYTYVVRNTGETYLSNLVVTDDKLGNVGTIAGPLAPNATATLTKTALSVSEDVTNIGTVTANPTDSEGADLVALENVTDTDDAVVTVTPVSPTPDRTICELLDFGKPFNAVIFGNLDVNGGDTEGNLLVWGNASLPAGYSVGLAEYGEPMPTADELTDALIVGGDLYIGPQGINGNVVYGGDYSGYDRKYQPYAVRHVTPVTIDGDGNVPEDLSGTTRDEMLARVNQVSSRIGAWEERGVVSKVKDESGSLTLVGNDPTRNIFNISAGEWSGNSANRTLDVPADSTVIINITGWEVAITNGAMVLPEGMTPNQVLIHYVDAGNLAIAGFSHEGAVLAPHADASFSGGAIQGLAIFGGNVTTTVGFEFHNFAMNVFHCPVNPSIRLVTTADSTPDGYLLRLTNAQDVTVHQTVINTGSSWLRSIALTTADGSVVAVDDLAPSMVAVVDTTIAAVSTGTVFTASVSAVPFTAAGGAVDGFATVTDSDIATVSFESGSEDPNAGGSEDPGSEPWSKADLHVSEIWFNVQPTITGEVFSVSVKVENTGDRNASGSAIKLYLAGLEHSLNSAEAGETPVATSSLGTLIPGEVKIFTFKGLVAQSTPGQFRVIALADPDNEIVEYSDGDNHGTLVYALNAVSVSISVGGDGVTLSWNNYWGQIYTVMESSNLEEWTPSAGYEGILSARDVDGSITNTVTIPFGDEMKFFKLRVDQQ